MFKLRRVKEHFMDLIECAAHFIHFKAYLGINGYKSAATYLTHPQLSEEQ